MKDLSIEEKAKRYDEAMGKLRTMRNAWNNLETDYSPKDVVSDIEHYFPELRESEDEMIRKHLIKHFRVKSKEKWNGIFVKDILAWLEKQGEQKPVDKVEPKFKVRYAGGEYNVLEVKDIAGVTSYGIEDEPNHIDYVKAENCEIVSEQNTDWSDEDEKFFKTALWHLSYSISNGNDTNIYCDITNWFRTLKNRVKPQSRQEWSEDDEKMFKEACGVVSAADYYSCDDKEKIEDWLKAIKERYAWKPSDEQIDALRYVCNHYVPTATDKLAWDALNTTELMLEQLEKL